MNPREAGFLLLTSRLGNPERKVLTMAQLRTLGERAANMEKPETDRDLQLRDLTALGYGQDMAGRILSLLEDEALLSHYLARGARQDCVPISRAGQRYPRTLKTRLGQEAPGCLWAKGDLSILDCPMIALVGSRDILPKNREFACEVGRQAALQGYALVSGNARGADKAAQAACLEAGGQVVSIVADALAQHPLRERVLYLSEDGYDEAFSSQRALSRNRCIHALGEKTFVAQCGCQTGGTWDGTEKNLRHHWSPVFVFRDGSRAQSLLVQMGASGVDRKELETIGDLETPQQCFL